MIEPRRTERDEVVFSECDTFEDSGGLGMTCSRARVSEVLNRKRPLTLAMIQRLRAGLGISADVLIGRSEAA